LQEWRWHVVTVLRQQIHARPDAKIEALLDEVLSYSQHRGAAMEAVPDGSQRLAMPIKIATDFGVMSFLGTTTVFGTPTEVTLSELALEMWFPADVETSAAAARMMAGEASETIATDSATTTNELAAFPAARPPCRVVRA
jgi:MmyB-like transcription regulator ligand binding domain